MTETSLGFKQSVELVKQEIPLRQYAATLTELRSVGERLLGRCPLPDHDEKTGSFYIYPDDDCERFHCYGCDRKGDLLDLHQLMYDHTEKWTALVELAEMYDIGLRASDEWFARQRRQKPVRDGLDRVKVRSAHRRLYRIMEPGVLAIDDPEERRKEARLVWRDLEPVARWLVVNAGTVRNRLSEESA